MTTKIDKLRMTAGSLPSLMMKKRWNHVDCIMGPQEMLDLLLAMAGEKPLYLRRAFEPSGWTELVRRTAQNFGALVMVGPMWTAENPYEGAPAWFPETIKKDWQGKPDKALYVTVDAALGREVQGVNLSGGRPTVEQEASILGYPLCCVRHSYEKHRDFCCALIRGYDAAANGDPEIMRKMVENDETVRILPEDQPRMDEVMNIRIAKFTSVNMCPQCFEMDDSPARQLSARQETFAWKIDPVLAGMIEQNYRDYGMDEMLSVDSHADSDKSV